MIGSHNSYTYLKSDVSIMNSFTRFWRCQDSTISDQYNMGVRYFDIRVVRAKNSFGKAVWQAAHGSAKLTKQWMSIKAICNMFKNTYKDCKFRVVLEKGDDDVAKAFKEEALACVDSCEALDWIIIKKPWTIIYRRQDSPMFHDYSYEDWDFVSALKSLISWPIKEHATKVNPTITKDMIESKTEVWFMDYVCGT